MRLRIALVLVAFVALVANGVDRASAASIGIQNAQFEDQPVLEHIDPVRGNYSSSAVGWVVGGSAGTFDPIEGTGPLQPYGPGTTDGYVGFMNAGSLSQTLSTFFQIGTEYRLTFDAGDRLDTVFPSTATVAFYAGTPANILQSFLLNVPGNGSFETQSVTLSAGAAAAGVGQAIGILFTSPSVQVNIDNVSLSALPVPSALLLFVSGFGILGWAAGRHKHQANA